MEPKRISRFLREISNLLIRFTDIHFENLMYLSLFFVKVGARIFISDSIGISERTRRNFIRCCVVGGGGVVRGRGSSRKGKGGGHEGRGKD